MEVKTYSYRARVGMILAIVVFFGLCTGVIANSAMNVDGPVRIRGLGTFSQASAPTVLWIMTALCVGFVAAGVLAALRSRDDCRLIRLDGDGIEAPRSAVSRTVIRLAWTDITDVAVKSVSGQTTMALRDLDRKLVIPKNGLNNGAAFDDLVAEVQDRVAHPAP